MNQLAFNGGTAILGVIGTFAFGEWTSLLGFFLLTIIVDYITGIIASIKEKQGLSSEVGFWGLAKKGLMLLIIMLAHQMDVVLDTDFIMTGSIYFYIANELISITENYGKMGLPLPEVIRKLITVLKDKGQK